MKKIIFSIPGHIVPHFSQLYLDSKKKDCVFFPRPFIFQFFTPEAYLLDKKISLLVRLGTVPTCKWCWCWPPSVVGSGFPPLLPGWPPRVHLSFTKNSLFSLKNIFIFFTSIIIIHFVLSVSCITANMYCKSFRLLTKSFRPVKFPNYSENFNITCYNLPLQCCQSPEYWAKWLKPPEFKIPLNVVLTNLFYFDRHFLFFGPGSLQRTWQHWLSVCCKLPNYKSMLNS